LLAVPTVAVVKLLSAHFWITRMLGEESGPHARVSGRPVVAPSVAPATQTGAPLTPEETDTPEEPPS
jgi:hypothetical protein